MINIKTETAKRDLYVGTIWTIIKLSYSLLSFKMMNIRRRLYSRLFFQFPLVRVETRIHTTWIPCFPSVHPS